MRLVLWILLLVLHFVGLVTGVRPWLDVSVYFESKVIRALFVEAALVKPIMLEQACFR